MDYKRELLLVIELNFQYLIMKTQQLMKAHAYLRDKEDSEKICEMMSMLIVHLLQHGKQYLDGIKKHHPELYTEIYNESQDEESPYIKELKNVIDSFNFTQENYEIMKDAIGIDGIDRDAVMKEMGL